jgi:transposase-like protein
MSSSKRSRRHFTTEQKVAILKRHMVDKVAVSDLCNELGLQPSVFYQWQRQALEKLAGAFSTPAADGPSKREKELVARTKELEAKLAKKDNVIAEVAAELVATKKASTGTSTSPISFSAVRSITCARSSMAPAVPSYIGRSASR